MVGLIFSYLIIKLFIYLVRVKDFWFAGTRLFSLWSYLMSSLQSFLEVKTTPYFFICFLGYCIFSNLVGRVPLNSLPRMHYCFTATLRVVLWVSLVVCVIKSQLKYFIRHILPYGAPVSLMLFLPLVEIFSHLIRPMTLIIRLSTNLSSGHIILYIFSYFTIMGGSYIYVALFILVLLEYCVVIIQSYIFVSLITMYLRETY